MVGLFVISAFVMITVLIIISGRNQHFFEKRVPFYINVDSSEGISQGSIVKALGTEIGLVSGMSLTQGRKIRVNIEIYEGQRALIRSDAKVIVNRLANINHALIQIEPGSMDVPVLPDNSSIPVEETPSLNDLLLGIAHIIQAADKHDLLTKFETLLPKLELTIENAHKIIAQIATGHGVLGAAVFDTTVEAELKTFVSSGSAVLQEAEGIVKLAQQRLIQLGPLLDNANYISQDIRGASHRLPAMIAELSEIINQTSTALTLINGELENIPGIVIDARRTLNKADHLIDSAQSTWPLSKDIEKNKASQLIPVHPPHD
ncbi:phospholipid/cholesterol/gamma-HCH transport system substrate-binding protein [Bathymodiolus platifrons methanotrophic gill symbiont]|nr:phospholipid/cholesterol/gamma-HCH transport system substrate-binding protein [Bathymodiolus platifrons methanotrophic gill symbiont]GFO74409.1 phospholipid/cholesterol/gamma-HCH transport system substrate-binding protein [Bathymodiolus platifrons methanotrophic gill symbiont]